MKLTKLAALFFLPLALFAQVNVQKQQGTNALTNGSIVVPSGMSISATGTGTIIATNTSGSTSGTSILYGNGSGGFSNVTIGTGLTFSSGTLASTASGGTVTSVGTTGTVNGITLTGGPITSTGTITLGGTLSGVSLTTQVSGTLPVANGGTGVTSSSGANSVVLRDSNSNASVNNLFEGFTIVTASGTTVTLTVASAENFVINGSGGQIIKLPDATTLSNGTDFIFNNNQSSGTVTIQNNSATTVCTLQSGSYIIVTLLSNSTAAGTWDYHNVAPSNASWSTNTLSWAGSFTNGTWNGNAIGALYGGTGTTGLTGYVYGNGTSAMTASTTIPTTALSGTVTNAQLANSAITFGATAASLGTTVSGFNAVSIGATTASTGAFTTLSASSTISGVGFTNYFASPPAIGGTAAAAGTFTALTATGTTTLATSLTGILKATSGVVSAATSGTDYLPTTGGTGVTTLGTITTGTWTGTSIAVANGGTGSTTATAAQRALTPATSTVTTGASPSVNWSLSNSFDLTLTSATAASMAFTNAQDGQVITIAIHQPASGTATTVSWSGITGILWAGGTAPTQTATLSKTDVYTFYYNATAAKYYGSYVQNF